MNSEATKAVQKRISRLLQACDSKQNIRESITTWFSSYASSKEYMMLSKDEKADMIKIYTALELFFA